MVELVNEILQGLSLLLPNSEKLDVRLWSIQHAYKLADELLEVTHRSGLQEVKPLSGWALHGTREG